MHFQSPAAATRRLSASALAPAPVPTSTSTWMTVLASAMACAVMLAAAAPVAAKPKAREATLGGGKASGPIMSMAQLRSCMAQQNHIETRNGEVATIKQQLAAERVAIDESAAALKTDLATLDRTNKEAIEAYVARAKAHDARIDGYEPRVTSFNAGVETLNAERAAYAKACEGRRYLEDDYNDIKGGK